jgi:hypothetical protein
VAIAEGSDTFLRQLPLILATLADCQSNFETIVLFVSVMLVNLLLQDGRTNYLEGLMRKLLYVFAYAERDSHVALRDHCP